MWFALSIVVTVLGYTWLFEGRAPRELVYLPSALVLGLTVWHNVIHGEWGFDWKALPAAARQTAVWTLGATAGILLAGLAAGTVHDRRDFLGTFLGLCVWGTLQQWVLLTAVLRGAQRGTSRRTGVGTAALLFGLVHMPNVFLAVMTSIGALIWCAIYDRYPNIIPMAISHAVTTVAILYAFDETITGRLRIGASYLRLVPDWPRPF